MSPGEVAARLAAAGCVAPEAETAELLAYAAGDGPTLDRLVHRRVLGEPLAWLVGSAEFCGMRVAVDPGVYVPRPHSEALARRAAALLPPGGVAVDLCTGCGAVAAWLQAAVPTATVVATDDDPAAVACARSNGVDARLGDLDVPLPPDLRHRVDVMTAVVPYVPTDALPFLPRDVVAFEPRPALDGGRRGLAVLSRVVAVAPGWLRPRGWLVLEVGGDQAGPVAEAMVGAGFTRLRVLRDDDGDARAVEGRFGIERTYDAGAVLHRNADIRPPDGRRAGEPT
ncbi:MAG: N5-glutamine methyltransferase family protein [Acidimicrobiia bacterium]